jgi:hypothetical protein
MTDWQNWHLSYDDPTHHLGRRLIVVCRRLDEALDRTAREQPRVLSLCAGDGRDVLSVLAARGSVPAARALLVEKDQVLARRAVDTAGALGVANVEVRCGDAGDPGTFADFLPADAVLVCGVFGNIAPADVRTVIATLPALVVAGGHVIWTRGGSSPDMRPQIRDWLTMSGLPERSFDGAPELFGVGVNQMPLSTLETRRELPERLFTFIR